MIADDPLNAQYPHFHQAGLILAVFLLAPLVFTLVVPIPEGAGGLLVYVLIQLLILGAVIGSMRAAMGLQLRALGLLQMGGGWHVLALPIVVLLLLSAVVLSPALSDETGQALEAYNQALLGPSTRANFPILLISIALVIPLVEELVFRGALQGWLMRHMPAFAAILITALAFALMHTPTLAVAATLVDEGLILLSLTLVGMGAGVVRALSGSLWPAVLVHGGYNGFILSLQTWAA